MVKLQDEVLQESIIIRLERGGQQGPVTVTTSTDDGFSDLTTHEHPFDRIVASVVEPGAFGDVPVLGFENHLNLFHENKRGLTEPLARGLAVFLNTTAVAEHFRRFNGHTQVNATDLKLMKYPSRDALIQLGEWAMQQGTLTQDRIDAKLGTLTA